MPFTVLNLSSETSFQYLLMCYLLMCSFIFFSVAFNVIANYTRADISNNEILALFLFF